MFGEESVGACGGKQNADESNIRNGGRVEEVS